MKAPGFDSAVLRAVTLEMASALAGGQVQKIRQPDEYTVLLRIHRYPDNVRLLLCAHPERFRAHLTQEDYPNPTPPPTFCMALRKYLEGGRILDVRQDDADRVLRITCATSWGDIQLVAELMGRHSNIVLLDSSGTVLEAIKHVGTKLSHRVVLPGRPYPPLPPAGKPSLWDTPLEPLQALWPDPPTPKALLETYGGMSPFLAETVLGEGGRERLVEVASQIRRGDTSPTLYLLDDGRPAGAWPLPSSTWPEAAQERSATMSAGLDRSFTERASTDHRQRLVRELKAILAREEQALAHRRSDLETIERQAAEADAWRIAGELLGANTHAIQRGAASVALPNYYDPDLKPLEVALDPTLSPRENAEAYFTRHRKAKAAADRVPEQRSELAAREAALQARRDQVEAADEAGLEKLLADWGPKADTVPVHGRKPEPEYPPGVRIRKYTSAEGYQILVGDNSTGNDYLTTRASDPDDIWLHVRAAASAHGVIRTNRNPDSVPHSTLRRAAELVAARSEAKGSGTIPVDYTLRRYVRKPRGAAPGRVTYEREKTLFVGPDKA